MRQSSTRLWALAVLVILVAGLLHVWAETSPWQSGGHGCPYCISGGWAVVATQTGFEVTLVTLRLEPELLRPLAKSPQTEDNAPRAPPLA